MYICKSLPIKLNIITTFPFNNIVINNLWFIFRTFEPGVYEAETLHSGLLKKLDSLLPEYASIQANYYHTLQEVNELRAQCHRLGLISGMMLGKTCVI